MKKRIVYIAILLATSVLVVGAALFLDFAKDQPQARASVDPKDAIVVLTGGRNRAEEGLNLLRKGGSGLLILSGVNRDSELDTIYLKKVSASERGSIILEKNARSTYENAVEVRRILNERGIKSIVLITSAYHMKRAGYMFRKLLPPDIEIKTISVSSPNFDEHQWWKGRGPGLLAVECMKYYWYVARFAVVGV